MSCSFWDASIQICIGIGHSYVLNIVEYENSIQTLSDIASCKYYLLFSEGHMHSPQTKCSHNF